MQECYCLLGVSKRAKSHPDIPRLTNCEFGWSGDVIATFQNEIIIEL